MNANIIAYFWNAGHQAALTAAAAKVPLATPEAVEAELARSTKYGERFAAWLPTSGIRVLPIVALSEVHAHLRVLQPDPDALKDKGERACIALAAADPTLVFVANDKAALWLALREVHRHGTNVLGVWVFLRRMHEDAGMSTEAIDQVARAAQGAAPSWWDSWRRSLEPNQPG